MPLYFYLRSNDDVFTIFLISAQQHRPWTRGCEVKRNLQSCATDFRANVKARDFVLSLSSLMKSLPIVRINELGQSE